MELNSLGKKRMKIKIAMKIFKQKEKNEKEKEKEKQTWPESIKQRAEQIGAIVKGGQSCHLSGLAVSSRKDLMWILPPEHGRCPGAALLSWCASFLWDEFCLHSRGRFYITVSIQQLLSRSFSWFCLDPVWVIFAGRVGTRNMGCRISSWLCSNVPERGRD